MKFLPSAVDPRRRCTACCPLFASDDFSDCCDQRAEVHCPGDELAVSSVREAHIWIPAQAAHVGRPVRWNVASSTPKHRLDPSFILEMLLSQLQAPFWFADTAFVVRCSTRSAHAMHIRSWRHQCVLRYARADPGFYCFELHVPNGAEDAGTRTFTFRKWHRLSRSTSWLIDWVEVRRGVHGCWTEAFRRRRFT